MSTPIAIDYDSLTELESLWLALEDEKRKTEELSEKLHDTLKTLNRKDKIIKSKES